MRTRDILNTVTRTLPDWHVYNDHQFGRITAYNPQAGCEVVVGLPDTDTNTIRIVRTRYELVEDVTVLDTAGMGEELGEWVEGKTVRQQRRNEDDK